MSYTISYVNLRYRIRYLETYDIVGNIVGRDTVLANRTYDIVRPIVYDVVCQTKGLSFISNRQRRKEGTLRASGLAGIEPTPARSVRAGYIS